MDRIRDSAIIAYPTENVLLMANFGKPWIYVVNNDFMETHCRGTVVFNRTQLLAYLPVESRHMVA